MKNKFGGLLRKVFKVTLYVIIGIFLLLLVLVGYINTRWGQDFVRGKAESFLSDKLKTVVHIGYLGYQLPKYIVVKDVLLLDQARDTLIAVKLLKTDIAMLQLLNKKIEVQQIAIEGMHSRIYRNVHDTDFNFTYIIAAFAGKTHKSTTKSKDTSSSYKFSIDKIEFEDIHVGFNDYAGGIRLAINLDKLRLKMKQLDIGKLLFHINDLSIAGLQASFSRDTSYLPVNTKPNRNSLQLIADNTSLQRISFQYKDELSKIFLGLDLGEMQLQLRKFGLDENIIDVKKLESKNTNVVLSMDLSAKAAQSDTATTLDSHTGWHIIATDANLDNVGFKMDDQSRVKQDLGIDYLHLNVTDAILDIKDFKYETDSIAGSIKYFSGREQCGLDVRKLKTDFKYNLQGAVLNNLYFQTPNTLLQDHLEVHYTSIAELVKKQQILQMNLHVVNSTVGMNDFLIFVPQLHDQQIIKKNKDGKFKVEGSVTGFLNNMNIAHFYFSGMNNTEILLNGTLGGMPEVKDLKYDLNIAKFKSSAGDVQQFIPDSVLAMIQMPDAFSITGKASGNMLDYNTDLSLASSDGKAYIKGFVTTSKGKNREQYDLSVKTDSLNIGRILKKDSLMGKVTGSIKVKGRSFDVKTMAASVDGAITSAYINRYGYHGITIEGKIAGKQGDVSIQSTDNNLRLLATGHGDFSNKYASVKGDIKIDSIDFRALKLYKTELRTSGVIHLDFPELNPDYPRGEFTWLKPVIVANGNRYAMDSLYVVSRPSTDTGQNIFADLSVLQATLKGKTPFTKIPDILKSHLNRHFMASVKDSVNDSASSVVSKTVTNISKRLEVKDTSGLPPGYNLELLVSITDKPVLHSLLPSLTSFDSVHIDAALARDSLVANANIPNLVYGSTILQNGKVQIRETDTAFIYSINAGELHQNKFVFWYADVHGKFDQHLITTNISLSDPAHKERFALAATLKQSGDSQVIQLQQGLKMDYKPWSVGQPDRIVFSKKGFYVENFEISNGDQSIKAKSERLQVNSPLKIDISNFSLANITGVISANDTMLAEGSLNGNITIQTLTPSLQVASDLQIQNLVVLKDSIGDIKLEVSNKTENVLDTKLTINGQGNDIAIAGAYYLKPMDGNNFNFNLDINALKLHSFETITKNELRNSSGYIRGNLKIEGTFSVPQIVGELRTDNLSTNIARLNADFKMPSEKIVFSPNTVTFNNFSLTDKKGNKAVVTGDISTKNLLNPGLNLKITANKWQAMHSTINDNKDYYGDLFLSTDLRLAGTITAPTIDGNLFILPGTKFTAVNPEANSQMQSAKGIVEFVNMRDTSRGKRLVVVKKDTIKHQFATGADINVNITIPKEAEFSLVMDRAAGDFLTVKGEAYLNTSISPGGEITLSGNYAIHSGTYQFNYNFIKRKFLIQDGSAITFTGDPIKGLNLDVTAIYEAKIPPYDLVMQQVTDPVQLNYYKQNLPFNVDLHLKGKVLHPEISFDVTLPENKVYPLSPDEIELVQARLTQLRTDTASLNKQVFAVLILGRFVSDDPLNSTTTLNSTAITSVSTFIGEQLNQVAGKLVRGVDISANLATTDDYTTGSIQSRTDLNLAASKQLMNDRLKLTVGNDFELQGPQTTVNQQSSYIPSNLATDYLLTSDGRYIVQAYRKYTDLGVLEGFVTETGVNFIVKLDYNNFKYSFLNHKPADTTQKKQGNNEK